MHDAQLTQNDDELDGDPIIFDEYKRLVEAKYPGNAFAISRLMKKFDDELMREAINNVSSKSASRKHLNQRLAVKEPYGWKLFPRWASDEASLGKICALQKQQINPTAIFGKIKPNDNKVQLDEMFADFDGMKPDAQRALSK